MHVQGEEVRTILFTFLTKKLTPFSINLKPTVHYITSKTAVAKLM